MTSFQAKIAWKRPRKRKNKNYRSVPLLLDRNRKFQKNSKKIVKKFKKLKNTIMAFSQVKTGRKRPRERENIKIIVTFRSNPTRNRK